MANGEMVLLIIWGTCILIFIPIIRVLLMQLIKAIVDYHRWLKIAKELYKNNSFSELSIFGRWNKLADAGYRYEHRSDKNNDAINNHQQVYINPISYFKDLYRMRKSKTTVREPNTKSCPNPELLIR